MSIKAITSEFYQTHNAFKQEEGSLVRRIRGVFFKIICDFWRTLGSYFFSTLSLNPNTKSLLKTFRVTDLTDEASWGSAEVGIREFKQKKRIGPVSVGHVCEFNFKKKYASVDFAGNFMNSLSSTILPDSNANLIFVPVVLKETFVEHVVAVVYDRTANRVELFDSKGLTSKDRSESIRCSEEVNLSQVLALVAQKYGNTETKLWENTAKHQYDSHNCAIHVLDYFERRANGESAESISLNPRSFNEANNTLREHYLNSIIT